ncbi:MAG: hypothetical protein V1725_06820 [archaeon]
MPDISAEQIRLLQDFSELVKKVSQAIRIYDGLYARRAACYAVLSGKKPGVLKRLFGKASAYEQGNPYEGLRIINDRERGVYAIIAEAHKRMLPALNALDTKWKRQQAHLFVLETYFANVQARQKEFLDREQQFINKKIDLRTFQNATKDYFALLDENATLILREYGNFYAPTDFAALVKKQQKSNPVLKHLDMFGFLTLFVAEFVGVAVFNHSVPDQFFDAKQLPSPSVFAEYVVICYLLTVFDVPNKSWGFVKKHSKSIATSIASVTFLKP